MDVCALIVLYSDMMNRQDIFEWCQKTYKVSPDYPWNDDNAVLRHKDNRKWFGVVLSVRSDRLPLAGSADPYCAYAETCQYLDILNVKCDPVMIGSFLTKSGYFPAYHMNKDKWISILLDGPEPDDEIKMLLDISFEMTRPKRLPGRK